MPTITLNWRSYVAQDSAYPGAGWITMVQWRDVNNTLITTTPGVYIIEVNQAPVYAGQALDLRDRFNGRSNTLHEMSITGAMLAHWAVWTTSVVISPANYAYRLDWAEYWLIRYLFVRDNRGPAPTHLLQNIELTSAFDAPQDGLRVQFDPTTAPAYLNDNSMPGWARPYANLVTYTYAPLTVVMP